MRDRARISILSDMLSFPTIKGKDWTSSTSMVEPAVGDLVSLSSAPDSKWYVAWLREVDENKGWPKYLLESIDDGSLCWWSNIGLNIYDRERVSGRPTWKWDDKQFGLNDRWKKTCRRHDAYIVLPCLPKFNSDGSVTLDIRVRFGWSEFSCPETFSNWKKLTMKEMGEYYIRCVEEYEARPKEIKSIRDTEETP